MPCSPAIPMSGAISFSDHPFLSAIGRRRHASHDAVYIRLIRSLFLFRNYGKAGMRQPSEPERAPLQEGMTPHTLSWEETMTWHGFVAHFRLEWLFIFHCLKER